MLPPGYSKYLLERSITCPISYMFIGDHHPGMSAGFVHPFVESHVQSVAAVGLIKMEVSFLVDFDALCELWQSDLTVGEASAHYTGIESHGTPFYQDLRSSVMHPIILFENALRSILG